MPANTQNVYQLVLNKPHSRQRGNKMYFKIYWPFHASEDTKCTSTNVDEKNPLPLWTQNVSEHVLNKHIKCPRGQEIYLNMMTKSVPYQRGQKMHLNLLTKPPPCKRGQ